MEDRSSQSAHRCGYVALVGEPNVGKSTLMNALVRERLAIVSPKPQTTRRRTLGILSGDDCQMIVLDTPGILQPKYPLQRAMMHAVSDALADADVACVLIDAAARRELPAAIPEAIRAFRGPKVAALNKIDLVRPKERLLPMLEAVTGLGLFEESIPLSALTGDGIDRLIEALKSRLPEGPPFYPPDQLTEQPERFFVAELVREQLFHQFSEEVPYAVEVEISEFKERPGAKDYIEAILFVEQESQKAIIIGRGGQAIRSLGESSRTEIESFLGRPVYLELRVKVMPKWRKSESILRRFGYRG